MAEDGVIKRKIRIVRAAAAEAAVENGVRAWRLALARAANDEIGLTLQISLITDSRRSLAELLDMQTDRALIAVLEGPGESLGFIALSQGLFSAMIEVQTIGRVASITPPARRPTRTDAAMSAGTIDRALTTLETLLAEAPDLAWAGGFRYASFLEDPRPLALLLDDQPFRVLMADVDIADGARTGTVVLALPAAGKGPRPAQTKPAADSAMAAARQWSETLSAAVMGSETRLDAVVARIRLPLKAVVALRRGDTLALGPATLDQTALEHSGGARIATGRLGQNKGLRALRLNAIETGPAATLVQATTAQLAQMRGLGATDGAGPDQTLARSA